MPFSLNTLKFMLIPYPYPNPVSTISPHGSLAIPDLKWSSSVAPLAVSDMSSVRGMFTVVANHGHSATLNRYLPHVPNSSHLVLSDLHILETALLTDINAVLAAGAPYHSNPLLQHIAAGIHLWGGRTGRGAFIGAGGFAASCPMTTYANMLDQLRTHPVGVALPAGNWPNIFNICQSFSNIGVAFMTKHLAFWSRALGSHLELPILDSVIFRTFISPGRVPTWADYVPYVNQLHADRATISVRSGLAGISISAIERALFNWANSPGAAHWNR